MSNKIAKKNNVKFIVILLLLAIASMTVYYVYSKNKSNDKLSENGSQFSGYIVDDGA